MTYKIALFIFCIFFFIACTKPNLYIDNAGTETRKVGIDGNTYVIEAGGTQSLKIAKGTHKIWLKNSQEKLLIDTIFSVQNGGIINTAKSRYISWRDLYGNEKYKEGRLNYRTLSYKNWIFKGDFTEYDSNKLFIEKNWEYELDETFPKDAMGSDLTHKEKMIISSKVYRMDDFAKDFIGKKDIDLGAKK